MEAPKLVCSSLLTIVACMIIGTSSSVGATWCVVKSTAKPNLLQPHLDYACGHGADCGPIQPGGICFNPNNIYSHTSYAYDSYYVRMGRAPGSCYFGGTAAIAVTDPSYGPCRYPSSLVSNDEGANTLITEHPMNNSKLPSTHQGVRKLGQSPQRDAQTNLTNLHSRHGLPFL